MAAAIAQAQEIDKAARVQSFDIAAPANVQGQHFGVIGAKRLGKSSPTPAVTLRSTLYPHIPPVCLRPTSLSSHLTNLPPLYPPCSPTPLPGVIPRSNFRPISLPPTPYPLRPPLPSGPQLRLLKLPIPPQFRCSAV